MIRCTFVSCSKSMGLLIDLLTWDNLYYFYTHRKLVSNIHRGKLQVEAATKTFQLYYKRDSDIGDFLWTFKNNVFTEHLRATASA